MLHFLIDRSENETRYILKIPCHVFILLTCLFDYRGHIVWVLCHIVYSLKLQQKFVWQCEYNLGVALMLHSLRDPLLIEVIIPILRNSSSNKQGGMGAFHVIYLPVLTWHVLSFPVLFLFACYSSYLLVKGNNMLYNICSSSMGTIWRSVAVRNTARYAVWGKKKKPDRRGAYWKHMWGISFSSPLVSSLFLVVELDIN